MAIRPARRLSPPSLAAIAVAAVALATVRPAAAPAAAQPAAGGFRLAATWRSAAVPLPAGVWRRAQGLDIGADGRVYVVDAAERRITIVDETDTPRLGADAATAGLVAPSHLAVDSAGGRIYVSDAGAGGVVVLDLAGARQALWPVPAPAGVAVLPDGSGIVVGSSDDGTVRVLAGDGSSRAAWPSQQTNERGDLVRGLDVDGGSRVHVLDGRGVVRTFSLAGTRLDSTDLDLPAGVTATDIVFVGHGGPTSGQRFLAASSIGVVVKAVVTGAWSLIPRGELFAVAAHPVRGIVASQPSRAGEGSFLFRWPAGTDRPASPERSWGDLAARPGTFEQPSAIVLAADGGLRVLDRQWRVQRFRPDGTVVDQHARPWLQHAPSAVTAGADGTLYVTDGGTLAAYDPAAGLRWQTPIGGGAGQAVALAIGPPPERAIVALDTLGERLERFDPATGRSIDALGLPASPDDSALWGDLDVDAAGDAYALDRVNGVVAVVPLGAGTAGPRTIVLAPRTRRMAVAADGQSLFGLDRDGWVQRFDAAGAPAGAFDAARFDLATASRPADLAVDAAGRVLVVDGAADVVSVWQPDAAIPPQTPPAGGAGCRATADKTAQPDRLALGQTVDVRLTLRGGCGARSAAAPIDILLVLDRSGSMAGEPLRLLRDAAASFIADIDFTTGRVGVVSFNESAVLDAPLSALPGPPRDAVRNLQAAGNTLIHTGLARARQELQQRGRPGARTVVVLFSDGIEDRDDATRTRQEADGLKRTFGVELFTVAIGGSSGLLRAVASDDAHAFVADGARFLYTIFEAIAGRVTTATLFRTVTITDELPPDMRFVPGSAVPPAVVQAAPGGGTTLVWTVADVPITGLGLGYRVEPLECGEAPTNVSAAAAYTDGYGQPGRLDFPVPRVVVDCGPPTAPATATATPAPTATATPTAAPSATATATRVPGPIFLPIGLRERCVPGERHADVVLAVDASSSMAGEKLAAARLAARLFVSLLELPRDQVALVAFDEQARLLAPLGSPADALGRAIDGLAPGSGTRIDRGLDLARDELFGPRHAGGNSRVVVVLTDGRQPDESRTIERADALRADGVVLYAVGLGGDVDRPFLERITGDPDRARVAPSPDDLAAVYRQVAGEVPCPPSAFWGGR